MKTQYDIEILDSGRTETIDLSTFAYVTGIIGGDTVTEPKLFFNISFGNGNSVSVLSEDRAVLVRKRKHILKARDTFLKKFYKNMAKLNAKSISNKKEIKRRNKVVKKELRLLKQIRDAITV